MSARSQSATACATSRGGGGGIGGDGARTAASSSGGGDRAGGEVATGTAPGEGAVVVTGRVAWGESGDVAVTNHPLAHPPPFRARLRPNHTRPREEPTMKTRITERLGIEHPIVQGGMHYVGFAEMAAAFC